MEPLLRPDKPGYFWKYTPYRRQEASWHVVKAALIEWETDSECSDERVLACTGGGVWTRCDRINRDGQDDGTRYFPANPPQYP